MNKKDFLKSLIELTRLTNDSDAIKYYEELIDERIEHGENETEVIKNLGDINEIANVIRIEEKISKNTDGKSNPFKNFTALIAVLLIASTPILLPVIFAGIMTALALFIALIAVIFSIGLVLIVCLFVPFAVIYELIVGTITMGGAIFTIGLCVTAISILYYVIKFFFFLANELNKLIVNKILKKITNFKSQKRGDINE